MRSARLLDFLVLGLSAFSVTEATLVRRQTGNDPTGVSTTSPTSPTPTPTPTPTPSTSSSSSSSSSKSSSSSQSSSSSLSSSVTSKPPGTTTSPTSPSTSNTSEVVETITQIITTTNSDGVQTTITSQTTSTSTPGLANNGSGSPSGMSTQTRNTVIGVVVGVGGAIILGGLAFVAWRIWGRRKAAEEDNDMMDYPSSAGEKPDTAGGGPMGGRTPFQSTLESYHAPTQVNTASNF